MAVYFFDSSALVKRHVKEAGSRWVRNLTKPKAAHTLYIVRITAVEITSAVTRRQRGGYLAAAQAGAILGHFRRHLLHRYSIVELTPALADEAMRVARTHGLRAYDAVQLAAALEVSRLYQTEGLNPVTLISADQSLNTAAVVEGLAIDDPSTHT